MAEDEIRVGLAKGCLAGLGLALLFFLVGGLFYVAGNAIGLGQSVSLLIGLVSGPTIVSAVVLGGVVMRSQRRLTEANRSHSDDATVTRDDA